MNLHEDDDKIDIILTSRGQTDQHDVEMSTIDGQRQDFNRTISSTSAEREIVSNRPSRTTTGRDANLGVDELITAKQRKIKVVVIVVALLLILASVILVAVTLSMSAHIDDMGKSVCFHL
jgi:hypothetical protein